MIIHYILFSVCCAKIGAVFASVRTGLWFDLHHQRLSWLHAMLRDGIHDVMSSEMMLCPFNGAMVFFLHRNQHYFTFLNEKNFKM